MNQFLELNLLVSISLTGSVISLHRLPIIIYPLVNLSTYLPVHLGSVSLESPELHKHVGDLGLLTQVPAVMWRRQTKLK